jgi:hypothetical protein
MIRHFRRYNLLSLGLFVGLVLAMVTSFAFRFGLESGAESLEHLASIYEDNELGCRNFLVRDPDVLFVGDSHSYAGWNLVEVSRALPQLDISSCTLGGLYVRSFKKIVEKVVDSDLSTRSIVYGASLRQFIIGRNREQQIQEHIRVLNQTWMQRIAAMDFRAEFLSLIDDVKGLQRTYKGQRSVADLDSMFQRQESDLQRVDTEVADAVILKVRNREFEKWQRIFSELTFDTDAETEIDKICSLVRRKNLKLYVLNIPESPTVEAMTPMAVKDNYARLLGRLGSCAVVLKNYSSADVGLNAKHFINREGRKDFPYHWFSKESPLIQTSTFSPSKHYDIDSLYDLDHMNIVGATHFSRFVMSDSEVRSNLVADGRM